MPAKRARAASQHGESQNKKATGSCREYALDLAPPRIAPAALMLHRRLLILGCVAVAATVCLLSLESLQFSFMTSHFIYADRSLQQWTA